MKLVEVVILVGTHCVSPVQNTTLATEANKVSCAVVVERDTVAGTLQVTPRTGGGPLVQAAVGRLMATAISLPAAPDTRAVAGLTPARPPQAPMTTEPMAAPPSQGGFAAAARKHEPTAPRVPAMAMQAALPKLLSSAVTAVEASVEPAPPPGKFVETPEGDGPSKPKAAATQHADQCREATKPVWYTNKEGRRKYRCLRSKKIALY